MLYKTFSFEKKIMKFLKNENFFIFPFHFWVLISRDISDKFTYLFQFFVNEIFSWILFLFFLLFLFHFSCVFSENLFLEKEIKKKCVFPGKINTLSEKELKKMKIEIQNSKLKRSFTEKQFKFILNNSNSHLNIKQQQNHTNYYWTKIQIFKYSNF